MNGEVNKSIENQVVEMNGFDSLSKLIYSKNECFNMSKSRYDYKIYREIIWTLFGQLGIEIKCRKCDIISQNGNRRLSIHHVDGNYNNNVFSNLEIVCMKCHQKIHQEKIRIGLEKRGMPRGKEAHQWVEKAKIECHSCRKPIERRPLELKQKKSLFCSPQCFFDKKKADGIKNRVEKPCFMCNGLFFSNPSDKRKYCSWSCVLDARRSGLIKIGRPKNG